MESPPARGDEVIADSEDEDGIPRQVPNGMGLLDPRFPGNAMSSIVPPSYEPPRTSLGYPTGFYQDILPSSIADRAKMRQRNTKPKFTEHTDSSPSTSSMKRAKKAVNPPDNVIELTSDEDDELALRPQAPAKPKPKPKAKAKTLATNSIDPRTPKTTTSDPAEGQPKARPKPRPIPKRSKTTHDATSPPPHVDSTSQVSLPVSTSSVAGPIPFRLLPSQLPPSDPPPPTSTAADYNVPHIETLPNPTTDFDAPLSSPSSLFSGASSPRVGRRKRKSHSVDELDSDQEVPVGAKGVDVDMDDSAHMRMMPPPPTFFAPSSSSSIAGGGDPLAQPQPGLEVVDLTILPPTMDPAMGAAPAKKTAKPRKPRKRKGEAQDVDDIVGEGEPKAKGSVKAKKTVKSKTQVEVLIMIPATKTKGKGKEKEKEVFKSKEFVEDDEDDGPTAVGTSASADAPAPAPAAAKPDSLTSLSSAPDSEGEGGGMLKLTSAKKRKSSASEENDAWLDEVLGSPKKKQKGKQNVIWSSDEEDEGAAASAAKPAQSSKAKGKGKNSIMSEGEDGGSVEAESVVYVQKKPAKESNKSKDRDKGVKKAKTKKGGKKVVADVEDEPLQIPDVESDKEPAVKADGIKENIQPTPEPETHPTPKPSSSKPAPDLPKESLFPSLSSRYTIAPRTKSTPMSELIRRVNSLPGSPFPAQRPSASSAGPNKRPPTSGMAYSPYLKSSRSMLSRIAPLHPNRRTPPPPLPPPPPRKKSKKELDMEEKWEEELVESVGGVTEWACMTDEERKEARRVKREMERAGWEE